MRRSLYVAACLMPLVFAAPARAEVGTRGITKAPVELTLREQRRSGIPFVAIAPPARGQPQLLGGNWSNSDAVLMGVGMFRVPKVDRNDPNRGNPMRDPSGKTMGIAAVGVSLRF